MGLVVVVDQLLIPMFHIGELPYKVSYLVLGVWALGVATDSADSAFARARRRDSMRFACAIGGILLCAWLGELALRAGHNAEGYAEFGRSALIYLLGVLAFGLGLNAVRFRIEWLSWVFFVSVGLNLAFILLREWLPASLVNFYYSAKVVEDFAISGIRDATDVLNLVRPRGIFSNPNGTMLIVNLVVLFLHLGYKHRLLRQPSVLSATGVLLLPLVLSILLATRGEFIVSAVLGVANFRVLRRGLTPPQVRRIQLILLAVALAVAGAIGAIDREGNIGENVARIATLVQILDTQRDDADAGNRTITRPLLAWESASARIAYSPLFGTGFASASPPPFDYGTQYFHNDWFRVCATSGLIGLALFVWILKTYCAPLGWIALLPFFVTGLTNTFILNIPAFIFYFFMIGVFRQKLRERAGGRHLPS